MENLPIFQKITQPHPFKVHHQIKLNNPKDSEEAWKIQCKSMDPNNFLELSKQNYLDKIII